MNILFLSVSDQQLHPMGKYVDLHRTYDFNNWIDGFSTLTHSFFSFDYYEYFVSNGPSATELKILRIIEEQVIQLLILPNIYYEIGVRFLDVLRGRGVKSVLVFFDDGSRFESTSRFYVGLCDFVITHESKHALKFYAPFHCHVNFFPCYPSVNHFNRLLANNSDTIPDLGDVTFVGANIADRSDFVSQLKKSGIALSVFGHGWPQGRITQQQMLQIFRDSKISLNFIKSGAASGGKQLKARSFEILLAGGFLLTEHDEELLDYFEIGKDIDTFSSVGECEEKIKYYLCNPEKRNAMQARALQKCRSVLNFEAAWCSYLNKIEYEKSTSSIHSSLDLPKSAIKTFINWNSQILVARLMIDRPDLALDQNKFCIRELNFLAKIYSNRVWFIFAQWLFLLPIHQGKSLLAKSALFMVFRKRLSVYFTK